MVHFLSAVVIAAMALSVTPTLAVPVVRHNNKEESKLIARSPAPFWTELAAVGAVGYGAHKFMKSGFFSRSKAKVANSPKKEDPPKEEEGALVPSPSYNRRPYKEEEGPGALVPSPSYYRRDIKDDYLLERDVDEYE